jgi:hypothetical protein
VVMALNRSGALDDPSLLLSRAARERARHRFARPGFFYLEGFGAAGGGSTSVLPPAPLRR